MSQHQQKVLKERERGKEKLAPCQLNPARDAAPLGRLDRHRCCLCGGVSPLEELGALSPRYRSAHQVHQVFFYPPPLSRIARVRARLGEPV